MAYEEKKYEHDNYFDWALSEKTGEKIHITMLSAEDSGKKGYRCLGANCGNQLIAVPVRKNPKHRPYFRHAPVNLKKGEIGCTFSNREYREALASSILTRLKKIKVPPVYKVNPENPNEHKLIEDSKYINAHRVQSQVTFYEDENGELHWGKNPDIKKRFIIRRPDVVFFNNEGKPILFIELVITHKLDDEKIADLYRLGIDTIQVKVPKSSEEEIEQSFHTIKNTKWVYNDKEATTNYIQIPGTNNQRILDADELENGLFKESFRCRIFRIKELIRGVGNCLESESYGFSKSYFDDEISRVERNKEAAQQKLVELEEQYREEALERNRDLEKGIISEQEDLEQRYIIKAKELREDTERAEQGLGDLEESNRRDALDRNRGEEGKIESKYDELEQRYLNKDRELRKSINELYNSIDIGNPIRREIEGEEKNIERYREEKERINGRVEREWGGVEKEINEECRIKMEVENFEIERLEEEQRSLDETVRSDVNAQIESAERSIRNIRKQQERVEEEIWDEFKREIEFEDSEIERITSEDLEYERAASEELSRELKESTTELSRTIKGFMGAERLGRDFSDAKREEAGYKRAREFFNKGTWKKG